MAFTKALYYPSIDIHDENWLKNAILYWDTIQTIVPRSMERPYKNDFSIRCADEGILKPLYVESGMSDVESLTYKAIKYFPRSEAKALKELMDGRPYDDIPKEELVDTISPDEFVPIYPEKLPWKIRSVIEQYGKFDREAPGYVGINSRFVEFYMTLLATKLSERHGVGLLTPLPVSNRLSTKFKLEGSLNEYFMRSPGDYEYPMLFRPARSLQENPPALAQGIISQFALEKISINPDISISKIIKFRKKRADELRRFRNEIEGLTESIDFQNPIDAIRQQVSDIYENKVIPAMTDLKESLTDAKISWLTENYLKIAFFSATPSGALALAGVESPLAILAGAGISLVASGMLYNRDKKKILRENPYSYLLAAEKKLT